MKQFTLAAFADEAGSDVEVQIRALQENGVPCLEIRGVGDKNITALTVDEAKELKKRLDDAGISVWSIGSPLGKISVGDEFAPHLDTFKHTLELSRVLGAGNIRMFSFFCPKGEAAYCRDIVFERLHQFCAAAQGSGITLCHENEKGIYGDTADRCLDILRNFPAIKAVYDPANFLQCGEDTIRAWELLEPYIAYMHVKDVREDGVVVPAGQGHVGMNPGEREAALVVGLLLLGKFVNLGIDEGALVIGARRVLLGPRSAVDDEQTNVLADLGRSQSDAFGLFEREEHVLGEFFHIGVIGRNRLAFAAQHLISVNYNRVYHNKIYKQFFAGNLAFARRYRGLRPRLQV